MIKLTATLCTIFPKIRCDYPRDASGQPIPQKLPDAQLNRYQGILGHYHVQTNKVDPGPAFQWDSVVNGGADPCGAEHADVVVPDLRQEHAVHPG